MNRILKFCYAAYTEAACLIVVENGTVAAEEVQVVCVGTIALCTTPVVAVRAHSGQTPIGVAAVAGGRKEKDVRSSPECATGFTGTIPISSPCTGAK